MDVVLIGAGGHGRVVLDILLTTAQHRVIGILDADAGLVGTRVHGVEVLGTIQLLPKLKKQHVRGAIVAIGDNRVRRGYLREIDQNQIDAINAIHPAATISPRATIGRNVVVCAGAIVCTDAQIADSVILNTSCRIDHECVIGDAAHIAPGATLAGRVTVGEEAFVGLGANIIQCLRIGARATVGAGAVVLKDVAPDRTAVGIPAREIR